jgi:Calcineurin-like phosphoesterase
MDRMRKVPAGALALLTLALSTFGAEATRSADAGPLARPAERGTQAPDQTRYVVGAAGDIACERKARGPGAPALCQYDDTAKLIRGTGLVEVLLLGDNQYEVGAYAAYMKYFHPTWGRSFANISPVPGNHEYGNDPSSSPRGYFRYFGDRVRGPDRLGYYSFDLGACPNDPCWHVIALNSELCFGSGGCGPATDPSDPGRGNLMYAWLEQDLAAHPDTSYPCTLAYWHHPRFSFSTASGASAAVGPLWELLHAAGADVVLNGHSHNYQRWRPMDPAGALDRAGGIRQFVVGTGGASRYALPGDDLPPNLARAQAHAFGILRLTLKSAGYRWAWASAPGQPAFRDAPARAVPCVRAVDSP